jgi:uncharacterized protein (TIGR02246 family)
MATDQNESEIRALVETIAGAIRAKDLAKVMALYAEDVVVYDVMPPVERGTAAVRTSVERWFGGFDGPIGFDMRDVRIAATRELAIAHATHHVTGKRKTGEPVDMWVRWSAAMLRIDGSWKIAHEHVSVPVDMAMKPALRV